MFFGPKFRPMLFVVFEFLQYVFVFCIPEDLKYSYLFIVKLTLCRALLYRYILCFFLFVSIALPC
jgi:hypothetical protein